MEDMADSLQLESSTSASLVHVQRVTSKARIITIAPSTECSVTPEDQCRHPTIARAPEINFNGHFENCSISLSISLYDIKRVYIFYLILMWFCIPFLL